MLDRLEASPGIHLFVGFCSVFIAGLRRRRDGGDHPGWAGKVSSRPSRPSCLRLELVAGADQDLVLGGAKIADAGTEILLAEIRIAIFATNQDVVGDGVFDTSTRSPSNEDVVFLAYSGDVQLAARRRDAGSCEDQRTVKGITDTTTPGRIPFKVGVLVFGEVVVEVVLNSVDDAARLEVVAGVNACGAVVQIFLGAENVV